MWKSLPEVLVIVGILSKSGTTHVEVEVLFLCFLIR